MHPTAPETLRSLEVRKMTWLYILSGLVALGLLIYLVAALFMAEDL